MTKTKKQLRAEAVERLKNMGDWCGSYRSAADFMKALLWDLRAIDEDTVCNALIYLLTDDVNDGSAHESGVSDADVDVTPEKRTKAEHDGADSREKLEADICAKLNDMARFSWRVDGIGYEYGIWKLEKRVKELTAERDEYREKFGKALDLAHEIARLAE